MTKSLNKKLVVKSTTDNLINIRDFIKDSAVSSGLKEDVIGKIILAVDEACTNIIKHAYKYSVDGEINVAVKADKSKFTIQITDSGNHFNPKEIPDPDIQKYHKEKKGGGLGMFLMKKLMDEVSYRNLTNNRNQVTLTKYIS